MQKLLLMDLNGNCIDLIGFWGTTSTQSQFDDIIIFLSAKIDVDGMYWQCSGFEKLGFQILEGEWAMSEYFLQQWTSLYK